MKRSALLVAQALPRIAARMTASLCLAFAATLATGAAFPDRPVRLVVPYPAGGGTDGAARIVAQKLSEIWGKGVVVDNRPGADTQIGNAIVQAAAPDGYTLLIVATTFAISKSLYSNLPYDPAKDFTPISPIGIAPYYLVVGTGVPANNVGELIALAKRSPGTLNYAMSSSTNYIAAELMKKAAGIDVMDVRYKGGAPAVLAVATGEVTYTLDTPLSVKAMLDAGKMRVLAVTGERRPPNLPEVPTFTEAGLGGADIGSWVAIAGPRGMPADLVESINAAVQSAIASPEIKQKLESAAFSPMYQNVAQFNAFLNREFERYEAVVKSNKLKP
ncbi:MAG: tripartite tricarboxylate transporter substrate binding protein [Betaproteobacteria bacterium]